MTGATGKFHAGHVLEELGNLALFPRQLVGVGEVLVLAAAAAAEERAAGGHARRGRRQHRHEVGLGEILVVAEDAHAHAFPGQREWHHDHPLGLGLAGEGHAAQP